jgi:hypothetical protein
MEESFEVMPAKAGIHSDGYTTWIAEKLHFLSGFGRYEGFFPVQLISLGRSFLKN